MVKLVSGSYLKSSDIKDGDIVVFNTGGGWVEQTKFPRPDGTPGTQFIIDVTWKSEKKMLRLNATSRKLLVEKYGNDTEKWIGKYAKLFLMSTYVGGDEKKMLVVKPTEGAVQPSNTPQAEPIEWEE